jgi:hypothetical protein
MEIIDLSVIVIELKRFIAQRLGVFAKAILWTQQEVTG